MTVYEALVKEQSSRCAVTESHFDNILRDEQSGRNNKWRIEMFQDSVDKAYLLGVAIDNLPIDVASMEV